MAGPHAVGDLGFTCAKSANPGPPKKRSQRGARSARRWLETVSATHKLTERGSRAPSPACAGARQMVAFRRPKRVRSRMSKRWRCPMRKQGTGQLAIGNGRVADRATAARTRAAVPIAYCLLPTAFARAARAQCIERSICSSTTRAPRSARSALVRRLVSATPRNVRRSGGLSGVSEPTSAPTASAMAPAASGVSS